MANQVIIVPTITIQESGNPIFPQGSTLVSISSGSLKYTGTVLMYNPQFAVASGVYPGVPVPFFNDGSAPSGVLFNAPIIYVRNLDPTIALGVTFWQPTSGAGSSQLANAFAIAPGGFMFWFNPVNQRIAAAGANPGAVGLGAVPNTGGSSATMNLTNATPLAAGTVMYAEVLIAA